MRRILERRNWFAATVMVAAFVVMGWLLAVGERADAADGDPAGETLPICHGDPVEDSPHTTACVDRSGWGVAVVRADGTKTGGYGPDSYTWVSKHDSPYGVTSFTFDADAKPYGKFGHDRSRGDY